MLVANISSDNDDELRDNERAHHKLKKYTVSFSAE